MEEAVRKALAIDRTSPARGRTVDITTVGRRSGKPRRIEIWFYRADGKVYLSSLPAKRGWYANLKANPRFTFHLKNSVVADLPATAKPITEEAERRRIFAQSRATLVASPSRPTSKTGWQAARLWRSPSMSRPIVADSSPGRLPQPLRPVGGPASRSPFHSRVV
jgi:deazaflavin-dependent oxidoreductase (nitroreductase family)